MDKNVILNLEKLIWCRLDGGGYQSTRIKYREAIPAVKLFGITIQSYIPAAFIDNHSYHDRCMSKEEIEKQHHIREDNVVTIKPHLRLKFEDGIYYEQFYNSLEEAQDSFKFINNKLYPNILLCN